MLCAVANKAALFAEEPKSWIIAVEEFKRIDVPEVYSGHSRIIPSMLLSRLSRISSRLVLPDEAQSRVLQELEDTRIGYLVQKNDLVLSKDKLVLSNDSKATIKKKRRDIDKQIQEKDKQIQEIDTKIELQKTTGKILDESLYDLVLWKDGKELYQRKDTVSLARSLSSDSVSGLISGTIEDIGGYFLVSVNFDTGFGKTQPLLVRQAMPYDGLEEIVSRIVEQILPELTNKQRVLIKFNINPPESKLFIDNRLVIDHSQTVVLFTGEHTIQVSAQGYNAAERIATFTGRDNFTVNIDLEPAKNVIVAFDTNFQSADLYFQTRYYGTTDLIAEIPAQTGIGEAVFGDVRTYFIYPLNSTASDTTRKMIIPVNRENTEQRIERQRKVLYWSLGLLYCSLPFSMISYGVATNKMQAYQDGKIEGTAANVDDINRWILVSDITKGVSITLGINFIFQLIRYLVAADQTIPKYAVENYKE